MRNYQCVTITTREDILEKFDVSLEEAQDLVMTARVMLGWVNPDDLAPSEEEAEE